MSQDLFAAFGQGPELVHQTQGGGKKTAFFENESITAESTSPQPEAAYDDEDDFGDFEDASAAQPPGSTVNPLPPSKESNTRPADSSKQDEAASDSRIGRHPFAEHMDFLFSGGDDEYDAGADDLEDLSKNPEAAMAYSKRLIAERERPSGTSSPIAPPSTISSGAGRDSSHRKEAPRSKSSEKPSTLRQDPRSPNKLKKKSGYVPPRDADVLFDADEAIQQGFAGSEEDDFGDFEHSEPNQAVSQMVPALSSNFDLLGLDETITPASTKQIPASAITRNVSQAPSRQAKPGSELATTSTADDDWDDFEEAEPSTIIPSSNANFLTPNPKQGSATTSVNSRKPDANDALPPTNVPPPAIVISMFPSHFMSAQQTILDPLARINSAQRQQLLSHPATVKFLQKYLQTAIVLGHVIAGRKLRWKRDQILAQSMRIGPAAAGGKSGMKLAGVDKSELAKEDREVLDTVRLWKAQVGKLRSAIASLATAISAKPMLVPDIAEQMPVKALKALEGGFVAPHACALCGLKREERVAKVDMYVDDSFDEWWIQSMSMHVSCRQFWDENKNKLRSR